MSDITVVEGTTVTLELNGVPVPAANLVDSVNGHVGDVQLTAADVGALTQTTADGRYRQQSVPLEDADIPAAIARDAEVVALVGAETSARTMALAAKADLVSGTVPDNQIPAGITRDSELTAAINAAINALLAGAPGALDTLNELAAAIGNDASFASTVTSALAGKVAISILTTDGDLFTRASGAITRITRAGLASDTAFTTAFQGLNANLSALAGLTFVADRLPYATGTGTLSLATFTAAARALLDDADASTMLSTLGFSTFAKTIIDDADGPAVLTTVGGVSRINGGLEGFSDHGTAGSTDTINLANGNSHRIVMGANLTVAFSGFTNAVECTVLVRYVQDATGGRSLTHPAAVKWPNGTVPTISTAANALNQFVYTSRDGGTTIYGNLVGAAYS